MFRKAVLALIGLVVISLVGCSSVSNNMAPDPSELSAKKLVLDYSCTGTYNKDANVNFAITNQNNRPIRALKISVADSDIGDGRLTIRMISPDLKNITPYLGGIYHGMEFVPGSAAAKINGVETRVDDSISSEAGTLIGDVPAGGKVELSFLSAARVFISTDCDGKVGETAIVTVTLVNQVNYTIHDLKILAYEDYLDDDGLGIGVNSPDLLVNVVDLARIFPGMIYVPGTATATIEGAIKAVEDSIYAKADSPDEAIILPPTASIGDLPGGKTMVIQFQIGVTPAT